MSRTCVKRCTSLIVIEAGQRIELLLEANAHGSRVQGVQICMGLQETPNSLTSRVDLCMKRALDYVTSFGCWSYNDIYIVSITPSIHHV